MQRHLTSRPARLAPCLVLLSCSAALLAGCHGRDDDGAPPQALGCADMAGKTVSAAAIGLPTGGATVTSATVVAASEAGNANGEYCKVLGAILPDAGAAAGTPNIHFQLNLPAAWNGKTVHMGGGGYNGTVVTPARSRSRPAWPRWRWATPPSARIPATWVTAPRPTSRSTKRRSPRAAARTSVTSTSRKPATRRSR
ncbi:tannase/feruloyl esterase family alpha/beta hydrolase [Massilia forsythiae]|uniref:tannase/feruloyl esterase family alpha/beta hydrolase n=1 Tax=Massilia forsythiae TaxID=2728020 RepID=UPI001E5E446A|nr:tannase/feruloyl esterase family alpha/beta hydrolase [Massilia forsythiae]